MHAVIFTGGLLRDGKPVQKVLKQADLVIAADSGAETALAFKIMPKIVIGDLDSLNPDIKIRLLKKGCEFKTYSHTKDQTDTVLAVEHSLGQGATQISLLGSTEGDRIDHILANLFAFMNINVPLKHINGSTTTWIAKGPQAVTITGQPKDLLSLIPLTETVTGVDIAHLLYPIDSRILTMASSWGISNELTAKQASVKFKTGTLLFVHTAH